MIFDDISDEALQVADDLLHKLIDEHGPDSEVAIALHRALRPMCDELDLRYEVCLRYGASLDSL